MFSSLKAFRSVPKTNNVLFTARLAAPLCQQRYFAKVYMKSHEWLDIGDDKVVTVGISKFAASALGDIVHVELPDAGNDCDAGEAVVDIESVKTASQVYAPIAGTIETVNDNLADAPEELTEDSAEGDSWLFKIKASDDIDTSEMMDEETYLKFCEEEGED